MTRVEAIARRVRDIESAILHRVAIRADAVHAECNRYLSALRSGSRRRRCGPLRERIRWARAAVAEVSP